MTQASSAATQQTETEDGYADFAKLIFERASRDTQSGSVFTTDVDPDKLWGHFLFSLPEERRQHYNCNCCRAFIQTYGGLAQVVEGRIAPLLFDARGSVPHFFYRAVEAVQDLVIRSKITGVFQWDGRVWGTPSNVSQKTGRRWTHLHAEVVPQRSTLETAFQRMARLKEDHGVLCRAFGEYGPAVVEEAIRVLKADVLTRPEKALAIAEWYRDVLAQRSNPNAVWLAVATAPAGFTHVKNTVVSTLFDDVAAGVGFEAASKRWAEKMHPLQYQRPTRAVGEGEVVAAQKLVEKLGVERSFERRFAKLADIREFLWRKPEALTEEQKAGGLFGHLVKKREQEVKRMQLPPKEVSFVEIQERLSKAKEVQIALPSYGNYMGVLTATHADAPQILQWGNPVSYYVYMGGSSSAEWLLTAGWKTPDAVFMAPHAWGGEKHPNHTNFVVFAFKQARDTRAKRGERHLGLFPEILKNDLHGARAVVEAHNKSRSPSGEDEAECNGFAFGAGDKFAKVDVRLDGDEFRLVRWS